MLVELASTASALLSGPLALPVSAPGPAQLWVRNPSYGQETAPTLAALPADSSWNGSRSMRCRTLPRWAWRGAAVAGTGETV